MKTKKQKNTTKNAFGGTVYAMKSVFGWVKRPFIRQNSLPQPDENESPAKLLKQAFFSKKSAVVALITFMGLFLFVFIAPLFVSMDSNYTDALQQNVAPGYSLRALPKALKNEIAYVDGFSDFTVGVSQSGKLYVWGNTKNRLQGYDLKSVPKQVYEEGTAFASAGKDHIIALTNRGNVVGWGDDSCGQYGVAPTLNALSFPEDLRQGISPQAVQTLACGYQATALVTKDGKGYVWGNKNAVRNLADFVEEDNLQDVAFTNYLLIGLKKDGTLTTGKRAYFRSSISSINGRLPSLNAYLVGRKVEKIAADSKCIALLTDENELIVAGAFENGEDELPALLDNEFFIDVCGGARHFVGLTNLGNVYAWGHNAYGQCNVRGEVGKDSRLFAGSLQTYIVSGQGKLQKSAGLKGYLMGTDGKGRDVYARIVHGGKMTMTVGSVAVLVSSVIAIFVGCIAGYFGGAVDALLMRITEIFSAIPFLPFAMLLSQIIKNYNVTETARIVIIMFILGALSWTGLARIIRGQVLAEREKEFVVGARALGVKEGKIAFRHVLPNVVSVILVSMTLNFASCLLTESSLSYLGFGVQQPRPTWGNMLTGSNNSTVIQRYWWQWLFPALFLSAAVVCINVVGDALRDAFDPKRRADK